MSDIEICNQALTRYCGVSRITSLDEDRAEAEQCKTHYQATLRALLEMHRWTFARTRRRLAQRENDRPEWRYRYTRPSDALRLLWINAPEAARILREANRSPDTDRETTSDSIYSDVPGAVAEYIANTGTSVWPQSFRDALAAQLATRICQNITSSSARISAAQRASQYYTDLAIAHDLQNEPAREINQTPDFLSVRGIGGA